MTIISKVCRKYFMVSKIVLDEEIFCDHKLLRSGLQLINILNEKTRLLQFFI
jgi:hypothetical protein